MNATLCRRKQSGSFLLEALISLLIFSVGLIAMIGLSTQALNQVSQSKSRNDASYLAGELIGQMWVSASTPATFDTTTWNGRVQNSLPGGAATVTVNGSQVAITISWADSKNAGVRHQYVTTSQIVRN